MSLAIKELNRALQRSQSSLDDVASSAAHLVTFNQRIAFCNVVQPGFAGVLIHVSPAG